jgi:hypothetical protein
MEWLVVSLVNVITPAVTSPESVLIAVERWLPDGKGVVDCLVISRVSRVMLNGENPSKSCVKFCTAQPVISIELRS